jgi:PHD/YefM family antitoxin component YafN of YafNO toxin-antitoxin module
MFCEVARGLGILYTITLLDRADVDSVELVLTDAGHNIVLVNKSKYILNWDKSTVVNTNPELKVMKQITQSQVRDKYK